MSLDQDVIAARIRDNAEPRHDTEQSRGNMHEPSVAEPEDHGIKDSECWPWLPRGHFHEHLPRSPNLARAEEQTQQGCERGDAGRFPDAADAREHDERLGRHAGGEEGVEREAKGGVRIAARGGAPGEEVWRGGREEGREEEGGEGAQLPRQQGEFGGGGEASGERRGRRGCACEGVESEVALQGGLEEAREAEERVAAEGGGEAEVPGG